MRHWCVPRVYGDKTVFLVSSGVPTGRSSKSFLRTPPKTEGRELSESRKPSRVTLVSVTPLLCSVWVTRERLTVGEGWALTLSYKQNTVTPNPTKQSVGNFWSYGGVTTGVCSFLEKRFENECSKDTSRETRTGGSRPWGRVGRLFEGEVWVPTGGGGVRG